MRDRENQDLEQMAQMCERLAAHIPDDRRRRRVLLLAENFRRISRNETPVDVKNEE